MNEQEPETVPTSSQIGSAVGLRETHVRICVPEAICRSCWRPWPCENIQWARVVLARDGRQAGA
jgi:hypothetical protein